jgi:hypothetical protein
MWLSLIWTKHALQKTSTVDSVIVVIMLNQPAGF